MSAATIAWSRRSRSVVGVAVVTRRRPCSDAPRQLIAIRVDAGVLEQFRKAARRKGVGYQTLINDVLAQHVRKDVA